MSNINSIKQLSDNITFLKPYLVMSNAVITFAKAYALWIDYFIVYAAAL